jgi:hypothetical protein
MYIDLKLSLHYQQFVFLIRLFNEFQVFQNLNNSFSNTHIQNVKLKEIVLKLKLVNENLTKNL